MSKVFFLTALCLFATEARGHDAAAVQELEARILHLEQVVIQLSQNSALALDGVVHRDGDTVTFSGVNLQVVNGLGATDEVNGLGNLIVGYNEVPLSREVPNTCSFGEFQNPTACRDNGERWQRVHRSGSHNLIVGPKHNYSQYAGIVSGKLNTLSSPFSSITAGARNRVSGDGGHVSGGTANHAFGFRAAIVGGENNLTGGFKALGDTPDFFRNGNHAVVVGGSWNQANDANAIVVGGYQNRAEGSGSVVTGGSQNTAGSAVDVVTGGIQNLVDSAGGSVISGGVGRVLFDDLGGWRAGDLSTEN